MYDIYLLIQIHQSYPWLSRKEYIIRKIDTLRLGDLMRNQTMHITICYTKNNYVLNNLKNIIPEEFNLSLNLFFLLDKYRQKSNQKINYNTP